VEHPFVRLAATKGLRYFSLKSEGVRRSKGDIVVFVDSDYLPENDCSGGFSNRSAIGPWTS
jgi:hypothetical protein